MIPIEYLPLFKFQTPYPKTGYDGGNDARAAEGPGPDRCHGAGGGQGPHTLAKTNLSNSRLHILRNDSFKLSISSPRV